MKAIRSTDILNKLDPARRANVRRQMADQDEKRCQKRAESAQTVPKGMNKGEKGYADRLRVRRYVGEIAAYYYEGARLKLAPGCTLTPDFLVVMPDGKIEFHEVKARKKGGGYWIEEDANVKVKLAPVVYPHFRFFIVWQAEFGGWQSKEVLPK